MGIVNGYMDEPGYNASNQKAANIKDIKPLSTTDDVKTQLEIELDTIQERTLEEEAELRAMRIKKRSDRKESK